MQCCTESVIVEACTEAVNNKVNWCHEKFSKNKPVLVKTVKPLGISFYLWDVGTDINLMVYHFSRGRYGWGVMTAVFIILPMMISSIVLLIMKRIKCSSRSILVKFLLALTALICSPIVPFSILVMDYITSFKADDSGDKNEQNCNDGNRNDSVSGDVNDGNRNDSVSGDVNDDYEYNDNENNATSATHDNNDGTCINEDNDDDDYDNDNNSNGDDDDNYNNDIDLFDVKFVKFCEALGESYPQLGLQTFIVAQDLHANEPITTSQWLSITLSFISVSIAIAVNIPTMISKLSGHLYKPTISSKIIFTIFGLLTVISRLMVACVYSMIHKRWWFVPIGMELSVSILIWNIKRWCPCSMFIPLDSTHQYHSKRDIAYIGLRWLRTAAYNCFTHSGLALSTINVSFAVGACYLDVSPTTAIINLTLASISCAANIVITAVPQFKGIRNDWLHINDNGESWLY